MLLDQPASLILHCTWQVLKCFQLAILFVNNVGHQLWNPKDVKSKGILHNFLEDQGV